MAPRVVSVDAFRSRFAASPAVVAVAPGRVNLIGEHVDYMGGRVLPAALSYTVAAAVGPVVPSTDDLAVTAVCAAGEWQCTRAQLQAAADAAANAEEPAAVCAAAGASERWATYVAGAVVEAARAFGEGAAPGLPGRCLAVSVSGDVPQGAGLSSSAALCVALVAAVARTAAAAPLEETDAWRTAVALAAQQVEHRWVGVRCGVMDQMVAAHGGDGTGAAAIAVDCATLAFERHRLGPVLQPFEGPGAGPWVLRPLLVHSMVAHELGGAYNTIRADLNDGEQRCGRPAVPFALSALEGRDPSEPAVEAAAAVAERYVTEAGSGAGLAESTAARLRYVAGEAARTALFTRALTEAGRGGHGARNPWAVHTELGALLTATHAGLRDALGVSTPELDFICSTAERLFGRDSGHGTACVLGARMVGGGFGGCALLWAAVSVPEADDAVGQVTLGLQDAFAAQFGVGPCRVFPVAFGRGLVLHGPHSTKDRSAQRYTAEGQAITRHAAAAVVIAASATDGSQPVEQGEPGDAMLSGAAVGRVLLVSSRRREGVWTVPRGGFDDTDADLAEAAHREAFEEAGAATAAPFAAIPGAAMRVVKGSAAVSTLPPQARALLADPTAAECDTATLITPCLCDARVAGVALLDEFPEAHERSRRWCPMDAAGAVVAPSGGSVKEETQELLRRVAAHLQ